MYFWPQDFQKQPFWPFLIGFWPTPRKISGNPGTGYTFRRGAAHVTRLGNDTKKGQSIFTTDWL